VFGRTDSGNVAPVRQIAGPTTGLCNPIGLVYDRVHDEIVVDNSHASPFACPITVTTYPGGASGDAAPVRTIGPGSLNHMVSPESVAVRTTAVDCSDPLIADGTPCDDGNPCTQTDICSGGVCVGSRPVVCGDPSACHVGVCDPGTGQCTYPNAPNGTPCNDDNACTQTDTCQSGVCVGSNPIVCTPLDQCHSPGTCNSLSGTCSNPSVPDGTSCDDGNPATSGDVCNGGVCGPPNPCNGVVCTPLDSCHLAGVCNPQTGQCSNPAIPPPGEVTGLTLAKASVTHLAWDAVGSAVYDVASGSLSSLASSGTTSASCLANDDNVENYLDTRPDPPVGGGYYYLVRAQTACGEGTYGFGSSGQERSLPAACP
jgi:hypothetical protein